MPFPSALILQKSHHAACFPEFDSNAVHLLNFSERNACYKHQIYTDSHIAQEPEFCPLIFALLADFRLPKNTLLNIYTNQQLPLEIIILLTDWSFALRSSFRGKINPFWINFFKIKDNYHFLWNLENINNLFTM